MPSDQAQTPVNYKQAIEDYLMTIPPNDRKGLRPKLKGFIAKLLEPPDTTT